MARIHRLQTSDQEPGREPGREAKLGDRQEGLLTAAWQEPAGRVGLLSCAGQRRSTQVLPTRNSAGQGSISSLFFKEFVLISFNFEGILLIAIGNYLNKNKYSEKRGEGRGREKKEGEKKRGIPFGPQICPSLPPFFPLSFFFSFLITQRMREQAEI